MSKYPQILARSKRFYSAATSVQVPLQVHGIEGRYATALYTAAVKKNCLKQVESELATIKSAVKKDPKMSAFLESPVLSRDAKKQGVSSMLPSSRYSETTRNLFILLAENSRLPQTDKIIDSFSQILAASRGEVNVNVTSAKPLESKAIERVRNILSKSKLVEKNQNIILNTTVNPSIVGGLIIEVGDKTIDMSISSRITKLNRMLTESI